VGTATAFLLAVVRVADEIVLVDRTAERARAVADDIADALPWTGHCRVVAGDFRDLANSTAVVVACGIRRNSAAESRLDLLGENAKLMVAVARKIADCAPETAIVVVSNPVDVLSQLALRASGFSPRRVIGSGTILDSARLAVALAQHFSVPPPAVCCNVCGEHGDSQVPLWSTASIDGECLEKFAAANGIPFSEEDRAALAGRTRLAASRIAKGKGGTCHGIAAAIARICGAIGGDIPTVLNVSALHENFEAVGDVFLSTPTVIRAGGVEKILPPIHSSEERAALAGSAAIIRRHFQLAMESLEKD
jgi:L-lactate dehydrogenase